MKKGFATLLFAALMSIHTGMQAQTISVRENAKVNISSRSYDECSSIIEFTLSPTDEYYFDFYITENNKKLTSSDIRLEGDASIFQFNQYDNIKFENGSYNGRTTTFYLNTRNGKPYTLSSELPSLTDPFLRIEGKTTIKEGDKVNFTSIACPTSEDYTYQWYENGKAIDGATSSSLSDYTPTTPTSTFKLEASQNGTLIKDATVSIRSLGTQKRFSIEPWWGVARAEVTEVAGYCNAVYQVELTINENEPQFIIIDGKANVTDLRNETSLTIEKKMGDTGDTGWRIANSDINGKKILFFIDARTNPFTLTNNIEEREFIVPTISVTKGKFKDGKAEVERGEAISFGTDLCKNSTSELTYQWQSSTNGGTSWTDLDGETESELTDYIVSGNNTQIRMLVSNGNFSNASVPITLVYAPSEISVEIENAKKINDTEYEAPANKTVSIKIIAERMSDAVISAESREFNFSTWQNTAFDGGDIWTFVPEKSLVYRITAEGTLNDTGAQGTITREFVLRIVHQSDNSDILWHDDFGHFTNATTYVTKDEDGMEQTYEGSISGIAIENYMTPDPNSFVKEHKFASLDPLFGSFSSDNCAGDGYKHYACWQDCNGIRVEDGYYAILTNPNTSNCGRTEDRDYWNGTDHTGNSNGGMLFVNCSMSSKGTIIYERELTLGNEYSDVQLLFSAFISNAAIKNGQKPVNVRLDIRDEDLNLVYSAASGDVMPRTTGEKWSNMTFLFNAMGRKKYIIQLTNNSEGGSESYGNDILLDDISIAICHPEIKLTATADKDALCKGDALTYTVTMTNSGLIDAPNVSVHMMLASNLSFEETASHDSTIYIGNIAAGSDHEVQMTLTASADEAGEAMTHFFVSQVDNEIYNTGEDARAASINMVDTVTVAINATPDVLNVDEYTSLAYCMNQPDAKNLGELTADEDNWTLQWATEWIDAESDWNWSNVVPTISTTTTTSPNGETFAVRQMSDKRCIGEKVELNYTVNPNPQVSLNNVADIKCYTGQGISTGSITINTDEQEGDVYAYNWYKDGELANYMQNPTGLEPGAYRLIVTNSFGCADSTIVANISGRPDSIAIALAQESNLRICSATRNGKIVVNVSGGTGNYNYTWTKGQEPIAAKGNSLTDLTEDNYIVEITDENGCENSAEFEVQRFDSIEDLRIDVTSNDTDNRILPGDKITFTANASRELVSLNWDNTGWSKEQTYEKTFVENDKVTVLASDGICPDVKAELPIKVIWPTIFSPYDIDGLNDEFLPSNIPGKEERANWHIIIFDRYGKKIYDGNCGWDGTYRRKIIPTGTYYYTVKFPNGKSHEGTIKVSKRD
ncbi:MAG: gliding motility-associated C-terminal domain-containing protein [Paludibacteraceae bacterium]|nr:gliding motility-associated C-terminal domain-containing protein [Paludibacteraceae bacterium]